MKKEKSKYKVNIYSIVQNNMVEKKVDLHESKPHINDYVNYFAPKMSNCYAIHFFELEDGKHYKLIESWIRTKRGWKQLR